MSIGFVFLGWIAGVVAAVLVAVVFGAGPLTVFGVFVGTGVFAVFALIALAALRSGDIAMPGISREGSAVPRSGDGVEAWEDDALRDVEETAAQRREASRSRLSAR